MKLEETINYCYTHRDDFIRDSDSISSGIEQFECLIECLESGHIKPDEIANYGMNYPHD